MQLELKLQVGLTRQYPRLKDLLMVVVYSSRPGLTGVAAMCDLSPSLLARMLKDDEEDQRHLPVDLLPKIIETTGDLRPIHWLAEKFIPDPETLRKAAMDQLAGMVPEITALVKTARGG